MISNQRKWLIEIVKNKGVYAKKFFNGSIKYKIFNEQNEEVTTISNSAFNNFSEMGFIEEDSTGPVKKYFITEKAFNYKFKKLKNEEQKKHACGQAPVL
jgi:hypothetical protein